MNCPIPQAELDVLFPLVGKSMIEVGNKKTSGTSYKKWLTEHYDVDHVSIDWNGKDGALPLDLRESIDMGPVDMVTNFGTTEHVSDQVPVWRNIHNWLKVGGVLSCATPLPGDWWWHGEFYPTLEFYEQFSDLNGYRIEYLGIKQDSPVRNIYTRMVKLCGDNFVMPSEDTIIINKIRPKYSK